MRGGFEELSTEVLVEILSYLCYVDLLTCRQVSRLYDTVIRHTPTLQCTIELGMAGYASGRASHNVIHRLDILRKERRTWLDPQPKHLKSFTIPSSDWFDARCYKDVVCGRVPDDPSRLDIFYLSTTVPDDQRVKQLHLDIDFDAVYIDPGQDLLILATSALAPDASGLRPPPRLHLRSLKTQKHHPSAKENFIDLASYGFPAVSFARRVKVQVSSEYLALTVMKSLAVEAILVWHWPSGTVTAALRSSSEIAYLTAFCTDDGHLLVNRHFRQANNNFAIHVYALHLNDEVPSLLATFELPKLNWDLGSWLNSSFFPGFRTYGSLAGAIGAGPMEFHPCHTLIQLRVDLQYTLYTPLSTFLSEAVLQNQRRATPLRFSWESWGPEHTRVLQEETESAIVCGYKAIYADRVLDFCPVSELTDGRDESISREPIALKSTIFADDVVTQLPYREVKLEFPNRLAGNQMQLFFMDRDGPKIVRATCEFILIPTDVEIYSLEPSTARPL